MSEADKTDPVVWLLLMERGRQTGDFELAATAKRELARLGVRVSYGRQRAQTKAGKRSAVPHD